MPDGDERKYDALWRLVRNLGIVGLPISVASALCAAAPRDRSVIFIDGAFRERLSDDIEAKPTPLDEGSKLAAATDRVFELVSVPGL